MRYWVNRKKPESLMRCYLLLLLIIFSGAQALVGQCAPLKAANPLTGYKNRSNRCEGFYITDVSSVYLELVTCTRGDLRFKPDATEVITLRVPSAAQQTVQIRALGIPSNLHYQMDAQLTASDKLNWDVASVLLKDPLTQRPSNLGLAAFSGEGPNRRYFPVECRSKLLPAPSTRDSIVLQWVGSARLASFRWRLDEGPYFSARGPFAAGRPVRITLPPGLPAGPHTVQIQFRGLNETTQQTKAYRLQL